MGTDSGTYKPAQGTVSKLFNLWLSREFRSTLGFSLREDQSFSPLLQQLSILKCNEQKEQKKNSVVEKSSQRVDVVHRAAITETVLLFQ